KSHYYDVAREFGRLSKLVAEEPPDRRTVIVTGGGPGIMEAANRGAYDVGVKSIGLNISLPREQFPNPYVTPDLCLQFHYFAMRKLHFLLRARALVAFPGGYGTFDEVFETLALIQTRKVKPLPVVLVGREYWRRAFDVDFLVDEGVIEEEDRELFWYAETAEEIWDGIRHWHAASEEPAFP
ncbi:MAG TPA: LOG family protein, partial [Gemmatimonadales bacterium]|nr:LOG family protein [Gemmatimonadales bacterium]